MNHRRLPAYLSSCLIVIGIVILIQLQHRHKLVAQNTRTPTDTLPTSSPRPVVLGVQIRTTNCIMTNNLPDITCAPKATIKTATNKQICGRIFPTSTGNISETTKSMIYNSYNHSSYTPGQYEINHLMSLGLGGSNELANLFPEPASPRTGFHEKDLVKNYLHNRVCE
jgi:hypothetical protein